MIWLINAILGFVSVVWQLPQCLLGLIVFVVCMGKKHDYMRYAGVIVVYWNLKQALSLGTFIFINKDDTHTSLLHEYGHILQSTMLGWLYLIVVGIPAAVWKYCFKSYRKRKNVYYYDRYPENWADKLVNIKRKDRRL